MCATERLYHCIIECLVLPIVRCPSADQLVVFKHYRHSRSSITGRGLRTGGLHRTVPACKRATSVLVCFIYSGSSLKLCLVHFTGRKRMLSKTGAEKFTRLICRVVYRMSQKRSHFIFNLKSVSLIIPDF